MVVVVVRAWRGQALRKQAGPWGVVAGTRYWVLVVTALVWVRGGNDVVVALKWGGEATAGCDVKPLLPKTAAHAPEYPSRRRQQEVVLVERKGRKRWIRARVVGVEVRQAAHVVGVGAPRSGGRQRAWPLSLGAQAPTCEGSRPSRNSWPYRPT